MVRVSINELWNQGMYATARVPKENVVGSFSGYFTEKTKCIYICRASEVDELKYTKNSKKEYIFFVENEAPAPKRSKHK
jgi:hypothetical protein